MISEMRVDELLRGIPMADELQTARHAMQTQAWLVGGAVRDLMIGRLPIDVDITTRHPEPLARRFAGLVGGHVVPLDPMHGIWRVALPGGVYFDFCQFRDHDIIADLRGRDFTMNAIGLRLPEGGQHTGGLIDPFHGLDDLGAGILRMVDRQAFRDDPARILRAFRFLSELHLTIDDDTWTALRAEADRLPLVAPERLLAELWKLMDGPYAASVLQRMDEAGVLPILLPEVQAAKGVTQNVYHHLDVWQHLLLAATMMARFLRHPDEGFGTLQTNFAPLLHDAHRRARLVFLALIHDIGKPDTRSEERGKVHFYRHEKIGAEIAARICHRLRMSREDTRAILTVMRQHMRPLFMLNALRDGKLTRRAMMNFFDDTEGYALEVMALALADKSAAQGEAADPEILAQLHALYRQLFTFFDTTYLPAREHPLLTGRELTQELRMAPGPDLGHLLRRAREMQIQGQLSSTDEALRWAKEQSQA